MIRTLSLGEKALTSSLLALGLVGAACSSSTKPGDPSSPGGGSSNMEPNDHAGAPSSSEGGKASGGHSGSGATDEAGAGAAGDDSAGAAGKSGATGESGAAGRTGESGAAGQTGESGAAGESGAGGEAAGCRNAASCASGVCGADHNCQSCLADQECAAPQVCGDNLCAPACGVDQEGSSLGCSTGLTCCSLHCVDRATDSEHCGACGTACATGQFCGVSGCQDSTLAAVCSVAKVTVVLDGQIGNETPARAIAQALATECMPAPVVREVSQDVADAVNITSGRPVAGGDELLVSAGGIFFAHLVSYVNTEPVAPVYFTQNGDNLEYRVRATDKLIVTNPYSGPHDATDAFVIQFIRDPSSGSLILNAQGFWESGTDAAAYYFVNALLPSISAQTKAWYAYQWTDADGDLKPSLDEIVLLDSGS